MAEHTVNNKRMAKNTLFLYVRMIIVMLANLYVVRALLDILGVVDYGIYNVVSGVVSMFSFLNGTLSTSSQRYFSISLAEGNFSKLQKQFRLNLSIFLLFILIVIIIAETIGLWYVNNKMTIPEERMFAANLIYQFAIISFAISLFSVPYNALIIAYEQMKTFAYIGLVEATAKVLIVVLVCFIDADKLVYYGIFMMVLTAATTLFYYMFCRMNYKECSYKMYWNRQEASDVIGFSGWHFLGTTSVVIRSQGINLLINAFFSPAVNAARAIAVQTESLVNQLAGNFFVAAKPQIYKTYASHQMTEFVGLIFRTSKICVFLVSFLAIPVIVNAGFIFSLWLKVVPDYTISFAQLVLFNTIIDSTSNPTICAALATKRIKLFYLVTGNLYILCLPFSYIALSMGYDARVTMIVSIVISLITAIARAFILERLFAFPLKKYLLLFSKLLLTSIFILCITFYVSKLFTLGILVVVMTGFVSVMLHLALYYFFVLDFSEKRLFLNIFFKLLIRK